MIFINPIGRSLFLESATLHIAAAPVCTRCREPIYSGHVTAEIHNAACSVNGERSYAAAIAQGRKEAAQRAALRGAA